MGNMKSSRSQEVYEAGVPSKAGWGGRRPGSGRKTRYGEPTRTMRVPTSRVGAVQSFLTRTDPVRAVVMRWRAELDATSGRARQPRWVKVAELLGELEAAMRG